MSRSARYCTLEVTYSFVHYPAFDSKIEAIVGQPFVETGSDFASRTLVFQFSTLFGRKVAMAAIAGSDIASLVEVNPGMPGVE